MSKGIASRADNKLLLKRYRAEARFKFYGFCAVLVALAFLLVLLYSIIIKGYTAFEQTNINVPIYFDKQVIDPDGSIGKDAAKLHMVNYAPLIYTALAKEFGEDISNHKIKVQIKKFYSTSAARELECLVSSHPEIIGSVKKVQFLASADIDMANKNQIDLSVPEEDRKVSNKQIEWMHTLKSKRELFLAFNKALFLNSASSSPEMAGLATAFIGSLYMMLIVLISALPFGVAAALYLEEYAPKNRFTDLLEININNLAAVPSIVFGLLGLSVFINLLELPRSSSLVGGLVLSLTVLPTIIISTRAALRAVSPSIKTGALALGASKTQAIFHHVLPSAVPGIVTGTIIGIAQAMGQTAPLLLIGMVAFVANYPVTPLDPATALPVQIYIWSGEMHRAFVERTSAAIIVLLLFMMLLNILAIVIRSKFEKNGKR